MTAIIEGYGFMFETDTKFGLRRMPGWSYESIKGRVREMSESGSSTFSIQKNKKAYFSFHSFLSPEMTF